MVDSAEAKQTLARYVRLLHESGVRSVSLNAAARAGLASLGKRAASAQPVAARRADPAPVRKAPSSAAPVAPSAIQPQIVGATKAEKLQNLARQVAACVQCPHLAKARTQTVFGVGNPDAELMFVGEAPGADEDKQGEPFVGRAGQLLTKMIGAMKLTREQVYIGNVLKCRPDMPPGASGNRKPERAEMNTCLPYLKAQIEIIRPKVIVALGATGVEGLLGLPSVKITQMRGRFVDLDGTPVMPTFHPSYLLRDHTNQEKRKAWEDLMQVMELLGLPITEKERGYFLKK